MKLLETTQQRWVDTIQQSLYETVIGRYNTDYTPNDTAGWDYSDRLFVVANGTKQYI